MGELSQLKGLGPKSENMLNQIGIYTKRDLAELGPVKTYLKLQDHPQIPTSLNLLYAMVGALADKNWIDIKQQEKERLLYELEDYKDFQALMNR